MIKDGGITSMPGFTAIRKRWKKNSENGGSNCLMNKNFQLKERNRERTIFDIRNRLNIPSTIISNI